MREFLTILSVGLFLTGSALVLAARAEASDGVANRAEAQKAETCRPKWPYIVLTCVA